MTTTNLNIRLDSDLRQRTNNVLERYGLTPAQAVKLFFTQIANTNEVPLSFDYDKHVVSESTRKILHQNSAEIAAGDCDLYETPEQAMAAMLEMAKP